MINEFALDPTLLHTWEAARFYLDKFGLDQGRFIAQFPNARMWAQYVLKQFPPNTSGGVDTDRKRVATRLEQLVMSALVFSAARGSVRWSEARPWVLNALEEHRLRPFHAIVTRDNPDSHPDVICGDDIDEQNPPPRWRPCRTIEVLRQGPAMAAAIGPLFQLAHTVVFVDRNFDPIDPGYQAALRSFLRLLWDRTPRKPVLRVEYHLGNEERPNEKNNKRIHSASEFVRLCRSNLATVIPLDMKVRFVRWRYRELHDRSVITDRGAVDFGQGLDAAGANEAIQKVKLTLLDSATSHRLLQEHLGAKPRYTLDAKSTVEVVGSSKG